MERIVVVYFSRDGHTQRIAREIAEACGADIEEVVESSRRRGAWGYLRSALEALLGIAPAILHARRHPREGDLVVIGTPIWAGNMASPVRSYILAQRDKFDRVAFFRTCGGSGQNKVLNDLQALCRRTPVATLALTERQCVAGAHDNELAAFVRALKQGQALAHVPSALHAGHSLS
jgi:flavodoxin